MISIDEAIAHEREVAAIQRNNDKLNKTLGKSSPYYNTDCIKCAEEHEQLADWLEELKELRKIKEDYVKGMQTSYEKFMYNKALDDIVTIIKERAGMDWEWDFYFIEEIAEQLKAGGK